MLTDFARDHAFTIAWFGLMTMVWLGWAQEDPGRESWRWKLGVGSVLGIGFAGIFGTALVMRWGEGSALAGKYPLFGVLTGAELLAAGLGCFVLWRRGRARWMAWWVAFVVALHFLPLAWLLADPSLIVLAVAQLALLGWLLPRLRSGDEATSRWVGPGMGATFLVFAAISAVVFLATRGAPW